MIKPKYLYINLNVQRHIVMISCIDFGNSSDAKYAFSRVAKM
uniref:Uncharacterized protein n=1 Tax=Anguilla anguilla TaxID=7936 RepID=A0A0E9W7R2_ANGAN